MLEPDIALADVRPGMFLLLGDDLLLEKRRAEFLFNEPKEVLAVHRGMGRDDNSFLSKGGMILRAEGWGQGKHRRIVLEMARNDEGRVRVCYPDDRHPVSVVSVYDPIDGEANGKAWQEPDTEQLIADPATGHVHSERDLSAYRLSPFWRDASVIWTALPASWIGMDCRMSDLLVHEAIGGVESPSTDGIGASETELYESVAIGIATLCWIDATLMVPGGALDPILGPVFNRLVAAFGSPEQLRLAALSLVEARLAETTADLTYLDRFKEQRDAMAVEVAARRNV